LKEGSKGFHPYRQKEREAVGHDTKLKTGTTSVLELLGLPFAKSPHPMWIFDRETYVFL